MGININNNHIWPYVDESFDYLKVSLFSQKVFLYEGISVIVIAVFLSFATKAWTLDCVCSANIFIYLWFYYYFHWFHSIGQYAIFLFLLHASILYLQKKYCLNGHGIHAMQKIVVMRMNIFKEQDIHQTRFIDISLEICVFLMRACIPVFIKIYIFFHIHFYIYRNEHWSYQVNF